MTRAALIVPLRPRQPLQLPPLTIAPTPAAPPRPQQSTRRRPVWLAVHLRAWQLHAALAALDGSAHATLSAQPLAVVADDRRATLLAVNTLAASRGVRIGHSMNAAIALCSSLQFLPRVERHEVELLQSLATVCEHYTSAVSLEPPNELLLEVRGSFRLFGGIEALLERITNDLRTHGAEPQLAISPTAQSALWLARACHTTRIVRPRELIPTISKLSVAHLHWPIETELSLTRFGVFTIGDLLRLPRAGLARRIGHTRLNELDYAVGRQRQVRKHHRTAEAYRDHILLDFEIETTQLLSAILEKRFARLAGYLTKRTLATDRVRIELIHREHAVTQIPIGLASPTADGAHLTKLMHEHLSRLTLPAPVVELVVRLERSQQAVASSQGLFRSIAHEMTAATIEPQARLLEELRARLGNDAVQSLIAANDYRPDRANEERAIELQTHVPPPTLPASLAPRPLWLLHEAKPIKVRDDQLNSGPEILDIGWHDEHRIDRAYFQTYSRRGARAWIYHNRACGGWFVHGLFG